MRWRIFAIAALIAALVGATFILLPAFPFANTTSERITNGSFEEGFGPDGVGLGWQKFDNGGNATYGWYDDTWDPVVWDGDHSQLIEINTFCRGASDPDRYAGIYQTVALVPGATYELKIRGMIRAREGDPVITGLEDPYSYRVQWGYDPTGGTDWKAVTNWVELPWNEVYPRLSPGPMLEYTTQFVAPSSQVTIFIRVWKKWGTPSREIDVNLDGISLVGPAPSDMMAPSIAMEVPDYPAVGQTYSVKVTATNNVGILALRFYDNGTLIGEATHSVGPLSMEREFSWTPATTGDHLLKAEAVDAGGSIASVQKAVHVGDWVEFITNGSFEGGFSADGVGLGWQKFDNGGNATYGWYDDTWTPVVWDGDHSQLIEINTFCRGASDPDRYAGIFQTVEGLTPGATYELSFHGIIRAVEGDPVIAGLEDPYSYQVQWGYDPAGGTDWKAVTNWVDVPWYDVYPRLSPGGFSDYVTSFKAPSERITIFIRLWKKWGTARREVDFNVDGISLKGYK
ncbi:MAG: hypothetical protein DRI61_08720 [Chloroflexi bacterium]|nr:MAG: hypothetical protein DRI61_08720 [Chloroflexota bacterium]HDN80763.1 hypothetical protein [Chloroflexota bacterium]